MYLSALAQSARSSAGLGDTKCCRAAAVGGRTRVAGEQRAFGDDRLGRAYSCGDRLLARVELMHSQRVTRSAGHREHLAGPCPIVQHKLDRDTRLVLVWVTQQQILLELAAGAPIGEAPGERRGDRAGTGRADAVV